MTKEAGLVKGWGVLRFGGMRGKPSLTGWARIVNLWLDYGGGIKKADSGLEPALGVFLLFEFRVGISGS